MTMDGETVSSMEILNRLLYNHQVGDSVELTIYRSGCQATVNLTIGEARG